MSRSLTRLVRAALLAVVAAPLLAVSDTFPAAGAGITITTFIHSSVQLEHAGRVIQVDPT